MTSTLFMKHIKHKCLFKEITIQTTTRPLLVQALLSQFQSHSSNNSSKSQNQKQNFKNSVLRSSPQRAPEWLRNLHADLMKSVKCFPPSTNAVGVEVAGADLYKHIETSSITPSQLLAMASFVQPGDPDQDKLVFTLCRNFDSMSVEEILTAADILYRNNVVSSAYSKAMVVYFYEMIESLCFTPSQIVRTIFHFQHIWPFATKLMVELEGKISECLSDFTLDEVSHVCSLLFYGQYRFKSMVLVDCIGQKLLREFDTLSVENLPMMMKTFRYANYTKVSFYKELGDRIASKNFLENFTNANQIMHFAFTFASVRVTHHRLFRHLLRRVLELKRPPRIKDLSKLIWACGTLMTNDKEHLEMIEAIVDLARESITEEQVMRYPDNLVDLLVGLAYLNIYPVDIIEQFLGEDTIKILIGMDSSRAKFPQLQFLDESLAIECPKYQKMLLTETQRHEVESHLQHLNEDVDKKLRKPLIPAFEVLRGLVGEENVQCCFVLPHFKTADILLAFDKKTKEFVRPQSCVDPLSLDQIKRVVVMLLSKAQTSFDDQPLGMLHCKLRQLSHLGYVVVQINADEAMSYTLLDKTKIQHKILGHVFEALDHPAMDFDKLSSV